MQNENNKAILLGSASEVATYSQSNNTQVMSRGQEEQVVKEEPLQNDDG